MAASWTNNGQVTGHFASICNEKHGKEAKTKDFSLAEEGSFPCKLKDHQNRNFMVSNTIAILLLLG